MALSSQTAEAPGKPGRFTALVEILVAFRHPVASVLGEVKPTDTELVVAQVVDQDHKEVRRLYSASGVLAGSVEAKTKPDRAILPRGSRLQSGA
jgi:hypothetical protein